MKPHPLLLALLILPLTGAAADDPRLSFLEQEVRNLKNQVQTLSRQMDEQRNRPDRISAPPPSGRSPGKSGLASVADQPQWINAAKWRELRRGMSELEVISSLGPPTSMREEQGTRVLLYALEIGASGFLGGSVKLRERAVVEVNQPSLQ